MRYGLFQMDLANGYNSPPSGGGNNNNTNSVNLHDGASVQNGGTSNGQMPNGYQKMHLQKLEGEFNIDLTCEIFKPFSPCIRPSYNDLLSDKILSNYTTY